MVEGILSCMSPGNSVVWGRKFGFVGFVSWRNMFLSALFPNGVGILVYLT